MTSARLPTLLIAAGSAVVLSTICALALHRTATEARAAQPAWKAEEVSQPIAARPNAEPSQQDYRDFVSTLPAEIDIHGLLAELQRAGSVTSVTVGGAKIHRRERMLGQLGQTELVVLLRGSYSGCKQVATEVLNRYPDATLVRLIIRKNTSPVDLDATIVLARWGAPEGGHSADGSRPEAGR